jgi:hypothetical protein
VKGGGKGVYGMNVNFFFNMCEGHSNFIAMLRCTVETPTDKQVKPQEKYSTIHIFSLCGAADILDMKEWHLFT